MTTPMDMPKRRPVAEPQKVEQVQEKVAVKKPFVRKPHLTDRPLKQHEGLMTLKSALTGRNV